MYLPSGHGIKTCLFGSYKCPQSLWSLSWSECFSTSMDIIRKNETKHMDLGLHYDHEGSFILEEGLLRVGPPEAPRQMECRSQWTWLATLQLGMVSHRLEALARWCSVALWSCSLPSRAWLRERRQLADESTCLLALCDGENTRIVQILESALFVLLLFEHRKNC